MSKAVSPNYCPLCNSTKISLFYEDKIRQYFHCFHCKLVFVPELFWLSTLAERAEYDLHENAINDPGYRRFLSRLSIPLLRKLGKTYKQGLDYGCGPAPALAEMFKEHGCLMNVYDPFYFRDHSVLNRCYDFICATEVVEHLRKPARDFEKLFSLLDNKGFLGIMTKLIVDEHAFKKWHYIRDQTHICFYSLETFEYLADLYKAKLEIVGNDVIIFQKQ